MGHLLAVRTGGWGSASCLGLVQSARSRLGRGPVTGLPGLGAGALKEALGVSCRRAPWFYLQFAGGGEKVRLCRKKKAERKGEKLLPDDRGEGRLSAPRSDSASLAPREMQQASLGPPTAEGVCSAPSPTTESPVLACPHLGIL